VAHRLQENQHEQRRAGATHDLRVRVLRMDENATWEAEVPAIINLPSELSGKVVGEVSASALHTL
jgi:hypothetical protein